MNHEGVTYRDASGDMVQPINREATPIDTRFATPEGLREIYPFWTLLGFKGLEYEKKQLYLNNVASKLVSDPKQLAYFYTEIEKIKLNKPEYKNLCRRFFSQLLDTYPKIAANQAEKLNSSEEHVKSLFEMYIQDESEIESLPTEPEKRAKKDIKEISGIILRGLVEGSKTPDEIVNLAYNIAIAGLSQNDPEKEKKAYQIISFNSPLLKKESFQAVNFVLSLYFENNDTLAKYIILTYTTDLLEKIHDPQETYKSNANFIVNENEHYQQGLERIKETITNKVRIRSLEDFIEEAGKYDFKKEMQKHQFDPNDYIDDLEFPENVISGSYKLRHLFVNKLSELLKSRGEIESDIIALTMPHDLSVRNVIVLKGDSRLEASKILTMDYIRGPGGKIDNPYAINDALNYLRPLNLDVEKQKPLEKLNQDKRNKLLTTHVYGLNPRGEKIIIDIDNSVGEIKSIVFQPGKHFGTKIALTIGQYTLPLYLDHHYHLKIDNNFELKITPAALVWWETIILSYLKNLLCDPHTVELDETNKLSFAEKGIIVKKYYGRKEHRRLLSYTENGQPEKYTIEQSNKFEEAYGITLEAYNKLFDDVRDDRYYTWVFPKEVEIDENVLPIVSRNPTAEDDIKQVLGRV